MKITKLTGVGVIGVLLTVLTACSTSNPTSPVDSTAPIAGKDSRSPEATQENVVTDESSSGDKALGDIVLGVIVPAEGAFAEIGDNIRDGLQIAINQANERGGVAGSHLTLKVADEGNGPETATQAARDLLSDGITLLGGLFTSADCGAVMPVVEEQDAVLITGSCASNDLNGAFTGESPFKNSFGVAVRDRSNARAIATVIAEQFPEVSKVSIFGYDYSWGKETWRTFRDTLTALEIPNEPGAEQWIPLGTSDFRTQVAAISRGVGDDPATQGLFLSTFGAGTAGFLQQAEAFDIADDVAYIASSGEYYNVARSFEGTAPDVWNTYDYNWAAFDNPLNDAFVNDYGALVNGKKPVGWTYHGYLIGLSYVAALEKAQSAAPADVRAALNGLEVDTPSGLLKMGSGSHQLSLPAVVTRTKGSPSEPDGVEVLFTKVVPYDGQ